MEDKNQKPLTLNELAKYNREVLFPYMHETFLTKDGLAKYNREVLFPYMHETFVVKKDFNEFKDTSLTKLDDITAKLDTLLTEKIAGDEQDKRKTNVLKIHNEALGRGKVLTADEIAQISQMNAF